MQGGVQAPAPAPPAPPAPAPVCWDAVLLSNDLFSAVWVWISDQDSKRSLRAANQAMRMQVDGAVVELTVPTDADPGEFRQALEVRWPGVKHLVMHITGDGSGLDSLAVATTSSLRRMEQLSVRQVVIWGGGGSHPLPAFSSNVAATLKVLDIRYCSLFSNIDSVRICAQLTRIQMDCTNISDLTPLASCTHLEEVWLAGCYGVRGLAPLMSCPRLRKLDVDACRTEVRNTQFEDLKAACTQLQDPSSMLLEGLVHDLDAGIPNNAQCEAAEALAVFADDGAQNQATIAAAGAIPRLVKLLGPGSTDRMHEAAAAALCNLALNNSENKVTIGRAIATAGAIPLLVKLVEPGTPAEVQKIAMVALRSLVAADDAQTQAAVIAAGVIPRMVKLLKPGCAAEDQQAAIDVLVDMATVGTVVPGSQIHAAILASGAVPPLLQLMESGSSPEVQESAIGALKSLAAVDLAQTQTAIIGTGIIPRMVQLLGPATAADVQTEAIGALRSLAAVSDLTDYPTSASKCTQIHTAMFAAGALPPLVQLLVRDTPEDVQVAAAGLLTKLASSDARHRVAIVDAGAITRLKRLVGRGTGASARVQSAVCSALGILECFQRFSV
ncbi:hypothetical protein FOA52_013923 [Chlamydomonas sp. UWO 241]|nr:hypothetical protein FOA52_013923 [Chlamydomonas sp. UWO 241]